MCDTKKEKQTGAANVRFWGWLKAIIVDGSVLGLVYAGGFLNLQWAYNLAIFILWTSIILAVIFCFIPAVVMIKDFKNTLQMKNNVIFKKYHFMTDVALIGLVVASGWIVTGIFMAVSKLLFNMRWDFLLEKSNNASNVEWNLDDA